MAPQDIHRKLKVEPFIPIRLYISDGSHYDVMENTHTHALPTEVAIGIDPDESGFPRKAIYIAPNHVTRIEPILTPKS